MYKRVNEHAGNRSAATGGIDSCSCEVDEKT
jgi:hypothetical protein